VNVCLKYWGLWGFVGCLWVFFLVVDGKGVFVKIGLSHKKVMKISMATLVFCICVVVVVVRFWFVNIVWFVNVGS